MIARRNSARPHATIGEGWRPEPTLANQVHPVARAPIQLDRDQELDDPSLHQRVMTGNIISTGDGDAETNNTAPPDVTARYRGLVWIVVRPTGREGLHYHGNHFPSGHDKVTDVELQP